MLLRRLHSRFPPLGSGFSIFVVKPMENLGFCPPDWGPFWGPFWGPSGGAFWDPFGVHFRVHLGTHLGTEKDHFVQVTNYQHSVGDSSRKCRVGSIRSHSPISLTLPLSSPKGDGFATTPAHGRRLPVRASVISNVTWEEVQRKLS